MKRTENTKGDNYFLDDTLDLEACVQMRHTCQDFYERQKITNVSLSSCNWQGIVCWAVVSYNSIFIVLSFCILHQGLSVLSNAHLSNPFMRNRAWKEEENVVMNLSFWYTPGERSCLPRETSPLGWHFYKCQTLLWPIEKREREREKKRTVKAWSLPYSVSNCF